MSDTHGADFSPENRPYQHADVALHCGDLTDGSKLVEFRSTLNMLHSIEAPLKLVIAGNHDFTMDIAACESKVAEAIPPLEPEFVAREYGILGQARQLFDDARHGGISIYALLRRMGLPISPKPWPSFRHQRRNRHRHHPRPSEGIMDYTYGRERAGCSDLFAAVARARPRIHCFGQIHEGLGAKLGTWKHSGSGSDNGADKPPNHFTAIDNENSPVIEKLAGLRRSTMDSDEMAQEKRVKLERLRQSRCATTSHCTHDEYPLQVGRQTLFINASITGGEDIVQRPWLVDIELPKRAEI
ncbi:hypothetical protein PV05_07393 [Exophiala xenobiotica]|uniref:Calcineurin-like phosphoesterase domain-containing protein n=1 Tax=Exophiala xenobiotica TaxID=348802 RepID=A0A0D2EI74_9EURO|nr:uncharacterized protein PV05_07393 [Exophiala xenobiotica]KIW55083.1 hypothetical protein PV05_07393 [Exophiala xenobiotica]